MILYNIIELYITLKCIDTPQCSVAPVWHVEITVSEVGSAGSQLGMTMRMAMRTQHSRRGSCRYVPPTPHIIYIPSGWLSFRYIIL